MSKMATPRELRGVHVLWAMAAFFGAVIAVNIAFAVAAIGSFPGEDVRRSYLQGLAYNDTLAARRTQAAQGWRASAGLLESEQGALLEVIMRDANGAPLDGLETEGTLRWPSAERFDRALQFAPAGEGRYLARLGSLHAGRWVLRARAADPNRGALDFEAELTWPSTP
jgi:nitrogen fixation protein FixH